MNKNKQKSFAFVLITIVLTVLLISIGASFAYFTANLSGEESATTITVTGGSMKITYSSGPNINIANIIPDDKAIDTKVFTVVGNNTTSLPMGYKISLVVESNTFSNLALKYKLISENTSSSGTPAPSRTTLTNIGTGPSTIDLGNGNFTVPTGGSKTHTYNLEIYFPNAEYLQNDDQDKQIKAHVTVENYNL